MQGGPASGVGGRAISSQPRQGMLTRVSRFFTELKRRKVYRVAAVYAGVGVAISLAVPDLFGAFGCPPWAARLAIALIVIGFPIALVLAWALEMTPEGIRMQGDECAAAGPGSHPSTDGSPSGVAPSDLAPSGAASPAAVAPAAGDLPGPHAPSSSAPLPPSIAVLPFSNLSADPEQEFFCHGMAEELINNLTHVEGLRVAARTSSFQFQESSADIREVGRRLGVASVLEGSVRRSGDRLRVTAQLIDAGDGYHLWSETYERELADVFAIQDEISRAIVETVRPTLVGESEPPPRRPSTRNVEAYDLFLRGRSFWHQRYRVGLQRGLEYFQKAAAMDPDFALPYTGISDAYVALSLYGFMPPKTAREKAENALARAFELDPDLGEARASRGWFRFMCAWEWKEAEEDYRRAMELSPSNVDVRAWYGILCAAQGRFTEGYAHLAEGKALDPLSSYLDSMEAAVASMARDFYRGVGITEEVLQRDPGYLFGVFIQQICLVGAGRTAEAVAAGERGVALSRNADFFRGLLAVSLAVAERRDEAWRMVGDLHEEKENRYVPNLPLARGFIALGEVDRSLDFLEAAVEDKEPYLFSVHQEPGWDPLRSHPRFRDLAARVGAGVVGSSYSG